MTVVTSAGDRGSADCQADDGALVPRLATRFPATSPHVMAVGATTIGLGADNRLESEVAWSDARWGRMRAGGGGTSRLFAGREVPGVSMLGDTLTGYSVYCTTCASSGWQSLGGTSGASSLFTAAAALAAESARRAGRPPPGLLNPLIYGAPRRSLVRDVRQGSNDLLGLGCCTAHRGFDRATGLGSVNAAELARLVSR